MSRKCPIYIKQPNHTASRCQMQSTRRVCRLSTFVKETIANFLNIDKVFPALCIPACIGLSEWKWQDTYIVRRRNRFHVDRCCLRSQLKPGHITSCESLTFTTWLLHSSERCLRFLLSLISRLAIHCENWHSSRYLLLSSTRVLSHCRFWVSHLGDSRNANCIAA